MNLDKDHMTENISQKSQNIASEQYAADYAESKNMENSVRLTLFSLAAAVIGAVCGSLPLLIQIFISGKTSNFLFIIVPLAIVFFMITFKSSRSRLAFVITLVFSLGAVLLVNFFLYKQVNNFSTLWSAVLSESLYSYLFIIIGSILGYEFLMNDKLNPPRA